MSTTVDLSAFIQTLRDAQLFVQGTATGTVTEIVADTRELEAAKINQVLFVARKGVTRDGHDFLQGLANNPKIAAFLVERIPENFKTTKPVIEVRDSAEAMSLGVKQISGDPTRNALVMAVTGTNGKTTTTFLFQSLFKVAGHRAARMGTIETEFEGKAVASELTTPDFSKIQKTFSEFRTKGADAFVFEASSHALEQRRLLGLEIDVAVFTNLTPEHLDYHRTMEAYYQAKRKVFFELLRGSCKKKKYAVVPEDGAYGSRLSEELSAAADIECLRWAFAEKASPKTRYVIQKWSTALEGSSLELKVDAKVHTFKTALVGRYNVENLMGMIVYGLGVGMSVEQVQKAIDQVPNVPGRLQKVDNSKGAFVFVDYAHTPDALENVLSTLRPLTGGKLKVLFGCGGDRDKLKRPKMGSIAELYGDEIFVTSDNPRTEDPDEIIQNILGGLQRLKPIHIDADRRASIRLAVSSLKAKDVLVVAGKGHEDYQIIGQTKHHFDDREEVSRAFNA